MALAEKNATFNGVKIVKNGLLHGTLIFTKPSELEVRVNTASLNLISIIAYKSISYDKYAIYATFKVLNCLDIFPY